MDVLVINSGSSSLKYQLINVESDRLLAKGLCERIGTEGSRFIQQVPGKEKYIIEKDLQNHADAVQLVIEGLTDPVQGVLKSIDQVDAIGHRIAHGGDKFSSSAVITDEVEQAIDECCTLAPLHNPPALMGIRACKAVLPGIGQVAVFDTAFHQTMAPEAYMYPIPYRYYETHKIRRYGFHGTSHKYVAQRAAAMLNKPLEELKLITVHLGNGSSIAAVDSGKSVDTSMGFTPLAGLMMGTRCGTIDPAILTFLMEKENMTFADINDMMNKESGFLGISGLSHDFRDVREAAYEKGDERSKLALNMFYHIIKSYIGSYAFEMGGLDAIVFTAGIGENNPDVRENSLAGLSAWGIAVDSEKNHNAKGECDIATADSKVRILAIPTNEELMIARETAQLLK